jgi:hypothetical protein
MIFVNMGNTSLKCPQRSCYHGAFSSHRRFTLVLLRDILFLPAFRLSTLLRDILFLPAFHLSTPAGHSILTGIPP